MESTAAWRRCQRTRKGEVQFDGGLGDFHVRAQAMAAILENSLYPGARQERAEIVLAAAVAQDNWIEGCVGAKGNNCAGGLSHESGRCDTGAEAESGCGLPPPIKSGRRESVPLPGGGWGQVSGGKGAGCALRPAI